MILINLCLRKRKRRYSGRSLAGRHLVNTGYVRIKTASGWRLEHRVVAAQRLGRALLPGEVVHHLDHDKTNNAPENLEVLPSQRHHGERHRGSGSKFTRSPDEPNSMIPCACGCGELIQMYDETGVRRRYSYTHQNRMQSAVVLERVLCCICINSADLSEIAEFAGTDVRSVSTLLQNLKKLGLARQLSRGTWVADEAGDFETDYWRRPSPEEFACR